jgi:effector-binding domain-containing protein
MNALYILCAVAVAVPLSSLGYEKAFVATRTGTVETKTIPARTLLVAQRNEGYFEKNNELFGSLFRYIKDNDVSMTVPVKARMDPGKMYFYVGRKDALKELEDTKAVKVVTEPEQLVMSIGVRGGYSEKNLQSAREKLLKNLNASGDWKMSGDDYVIFWNAPYVPAFMKRFEVHVPIAPKD